MPCSGGVSVAPGGNPMLLHPEMSQTSHRTRSNVSGFQGERPMGELAYIEGEFVPLSEAKVG